MMGLLPGKDRQSNPDWKLAATDRVMRPGSSSCNRYVACLYLHTDHQSMTNRKFQNKQEMEKH